MRSPGSSAADTHIFGPELKLVFDVEDMLTGSGTARATPLLAAVSGMSNAANFFYGGNVSFTMWAPRSGPPRLTLARRRTVSGANQFSGPTIFDSIQKQQTSKGKGITEIAGERTNTPAGSGRGPVAGPGWPPRNRDRDAPQIFSVRKGLRRPQRRRVRRTRRPKRVTAKRPNSSIRCHTLEPRLTEVHTDRRIQRFMQTTPVNSHWGPKAFETCHELATEFVVMDYWKGRSVKQPKETTLKLLKEVRGGRRGRCCGGHGGIMLAMIALVSACSRK